LPCLASRFDRNPGWESAGCSSTQGDCVDDRRCGLNAVGGAGTPLQCVGYLIRKYAENETQHSVSTRSDRVRMYRTRLRIFEARRRGTGLIKLRMKGCFRRRSRRKPHHGHHLDLQSSTLDLPHHRLRPGKQMGRDPFEPTQEEDDERGNRPARR